MEPFLTAVDGLQAAQTYAGPIPGGVVDALSKSMAFRGFSREQLAEIATLMRPVAFQPGELVYRQGTVPDGMYVIENGDVQLWHRLTDSRQDLVRFGSGNALCASSLLASAGSMASAECVTACRIWVLEHRAFDGLKAQRHPAAFGILTAGAMGMARALRGGLIHFRKAAGQSTARPEPLEARAPLVGRPLGPADDALLQVIPALRAWPQSDLAELKSIARLHELARGQPLLLEGEPAGSMFVVLRGAIEVSTQRGDQKVRHGLRGPGGLCGQEALGDGGSQLFDCTSRERALVLEVPRAELDALVLDRSVLGLRLYELLNHTLSGGFHQALSPFLQRSELPEGQASISADEIVGLSDLPST